MAKFGIKMIFTPEVMEGGKPLYGTGDGAFKNVKDELRTIMTAPGKFKYVTGFSVGDIENNVRLTREEKDIYLKALPAVRERLAKERGEEALDPSNDIFWGQYSNRTIDNSIMDLLFNPEQDLDAMILKQNVIGGGYDFIAHSFDSATENRMAYYITEEDEYYEREFEDENFQLKAMGRLNQLNENGSLKDILYLTWLCKTDSTKGFTLNSSKSVMISHLIAYVKGKLVKNAKKSCAKNFVEYSQLLKTDKESAIIEAIFNIADFKGKIFFEKGKFTTTAKRTVLGSTKAESINILLHPNNIEELGALKAEIDKELMK